MKTVYVTTKQKQKIDELVEKYGDKTEVLTRHSCFLKGYSDCTEDYLCLKDMSVDTLAAILFVEGSYTVMEGLKLEITWEEHINTLESGYISHSYSALEVAFKLRAMAEDYNLDLKRIMFSEEDKEV